MNSKLQDTTNISFEDFKKGILHDYEIAVTSRECSLLGRREVLTGKAKFGIFGDGKEVPQLAWAHAFKNGDFRSGYYRDQTFMMAIGKLDPISFFAGLYANTDIKEDPMSAGRQMGGHFGTHSLDENGKWVNLMAQKNSSADISPTAGQMPRLLGLAQASKYYREEQPKESEFFTNNGNEIAWGTIGNASTSEGLFFETINAAGVMQVPMVISVWDDEYGISVHAKHQTTKESISKILSGFQRSKDENGYEILEAFAWDYPSLMEVYEKASILARTAHVPVLIHVKEVTQPQGHSTSGSHERYKSVSRLQWEKENDCNLKMRSWILDNGFASAEELVSLEKRIKKEVREAKKEAWNRFIALHIEEKNKVVAFLDALANVSVNKVFINKIKNDLIAIEEPIKKDMLSKARKVLRYVREEQSSEKQALINWISDFAAAMQPKYSSHLYSETSNKATEVNEVTPTYDIDAPIVDGRIVLRDNFDQLLGNHSKLLIFGEDSGTIGDVNQGLEGMQEKYGSHRVADTGIREATIIGQGIGMAMRGLRPIAEIQYLDYLLYGLQILSDDLATLHYRTAGYQKAPLIVRTRGHRLEGIWHAGSPMGAIIHLLRGMYILTPRNMVKAAGFYNTLMEVEEPALVIENLNGYRLKEKHPNNLPEIRTPIGQVEKVIEGSHITVVSYGATFNIVDRVAKDLKEVDIHIELIDAQSLLPFDINHDVVKSVQKTNRLLIVDEDVPGGASAYLLQEIMEKQGAYAFLDSMPQTLTSKAHRPAYSSDGDYFSKPNAEDIFEKIYIMMHEFDPKKYPKLY